MTRRRRTAKLTHAQRGRPLYPHTVGPDEGLAVADGSACRACGYLHCACPASIDEPPIVEEIERGNSIHIEQPEINISVEGMEQFRKNMERMTKAVGRVGKAAGGAAGVFGGKSTFFAHDGEAPCDPPPQRGNAVAGRMSELQISTDGGLTFISVGGIMDLNLEQTRERIEIDYADDGSRPVCTNARCPSNAGAEAIELDAEPGHCAHCFSRMKVVYAPQEYLDCGVTSTITVNAHYMPDDLGQVEILGDRGCPLHVRLHPEGRSVGFTQLDGEGCLVSYNIDSRGDDLMSLGLKIRMNDMRRSHCY